MSNAGIGLIYVIPQTKHGNLELGNVRDYSFSEIQWTFLSFQNGQFVSKKPNEFFGKWDGNRGGGNEQ